ncbi:DUF421 domain-containing protein [Paenibacillus sp. GCM10027629]|uniref:DUF421 domain-containing protein n=1 Tax=Paenibacillus sp. GCM10027629 TaxID=3273414 RepID=UPI003624E5D2
MNQMFEIVIRSVASFGIMMVIARILGKATISQMTYHDFVAAITLGAITANLAFNVKMNGWQLLVSLFIFGSIAYLFLILAMKNRTIRKWISGQPTIIIQEGQILENNMRKMKFTLDTLNQELREKNIFNIEEVEYAVLELNGKLSVLRKEEYLPVTRKDFKMKSKKQSFPTELIMDGELIDDNLKLSDVNKEWLLQQVKKRGLTVKDINYAVKSSNGHLFLDPYTDQIRHPIDKE